MDFITVVVVMFGLFVLFLIYGILRVGIRIGVESAIGNIVGGFLFEFSNDKELVEQMRELKVAIKNNANWYGLVIDEDRYATTRKIGSALFHLGVDEGALHQTKITTKKENEADVRMDRKALNDVAWLADYGFRVWIAGNENEFRIGERLNKDVAETMMNELETFGWGLTDVGRGFVYCSWFGNRFYCFCLF